MTVTPRTIKCILFFLFSTVSAYSFAVEQLVILQTTDLHGCILQNEESPGVLKLASAIKREYVPDKTLLIDCGDTFEGSFEAATTQGQIMVPVMNALPYDAWIPGNHDFDWGPKRLLELASQLKCAKLMANVNIAGKTPPEGFAAWTLVKKNGLKIAVVGMTSPHLDKWLWGAQIEGTEARDATETLDKLMADVVAVKPDVIIMAIHAGKFSPERLGGNDGPIYLVARRHPEIDLILGGHTHLEEPGERVGRSTWFAQAGQHAQALLRVDLEFDLAKKRITHLESKILKADGESPDQELSKRLEPELARCAEAGEKIVGKLPEKLGPASKRKGAANSLTEFLCEALAKETVADLAFLAATSQSSLGPGAVTERRLHDAVPYENQAATLELSPSQCKAIIEEQASLPDKSRRMSCHGVEFKLSKEGKVEGALKLTKDGTEWSDETRRLKAAFSGYDLASAGGRLPKLAEIARDPACRASDAGISTRDALRKRLAGLQSEGSGRIFNVSTEEAER